MIFLLSGVGNALAAEPSGPFSPANVTAGNMSVIIDYNGTGRPGDVLSITADFNKSVANATISVTNDPNFVGASNANLVGASLPTDDLMTPLGDNELGGNSFGYDFEIPEDITGGLGVDITPLDSDGNPLSDESYPGGFDFLDDGLGVDPYIDIVSPDSEFAKEKCVKFNFSAYDYAGYGQAGGQVTYTFYLDGITKNNGVLTSGAYKNLEFELADGYHTWEIKTRDSYGDVHTTGSRDLYVDTQCPSIKLIIPLDCSKEVINDATEFNFTCEDALAAQYSNLDLTYTLYIDGQVAKRYGGFGDSFGENITGAAKSGIPVTEEVELDDGAHNWSVSVWDGAGNSVTSEVRKFYVDLNGLTVSSVSPSGVYVSKNPTFNFTVGGGAGLPFTYKLLVDGKEIKASCDSDCDCDGGYTGDEGENGCVGCSGEECDGSCFVVGKDIYSIKAEVADGFNKNWTVIVTDSTTGRSYQTDLKSFSVDSVAPACVANLNVVDAPGETYWNGLSNSPGLYVSWNASTEKDLASKPYDVLISTFKPNCIEDMEKVVSTSDKNLTIVNCTGKPLIYGKDYWVAVIARDNASNYEKSFSMCGPVQTYEDMDIMLDEGWNLKSVPRKLVESNACPESVFGNGSTVIYWDGSCWKFPDTIEPCKGYWVYTKEARLNSVKLKGMSSDSANPDVPPSLTLTPGWHMIGHTSTYAAPWQLTLASLNSFNSVLGSDYKFSNIITYGGSEGWGGIIPDASNNMTGEVKYVNGTDSLPVAALQTDSYMVPGQGYWIFIKNEGIYASIENVYNPYVGQETDDDTDNGTLPDNFDPFDQSTWPEGFDLNDPNTWPADFDLSDWIPLPQ